MRLTLRTLLAWLDDTLRPAEVREIGKQVAESPYAQELAERIHRVSRQRRLSVPSSSGPDGTDANLVASYLDNELDPASVADFEKKCLISDVNLAEAACVHQILSLLGQKVKVPDEARSRMYQLVRGRESVAKSAGAKRRSRPPEPLTAPIAAWEVSEPASGGIPQRFGPAIACFVLIALASFSAWKSLTTTDNPTTQLLPEVVIAKNDPTAPRAVDGDNPAATKDENETPDAEKVAAADAMANSTTGTKGADGAADAPVDLASNTANPKGTEAAPTKKADILPTVPPGSAGIAEPASAILLRYNPERREWERLSENTKVNRADRLLSLSPFRSSLTLGKQRVVLVGETELSVLSKAPDEIPGLELAHGRLLLETSSESKISISTGSRTIHIELTPDSLVSVEKWDMSLNGKAPAKNPAFLIACVRGKAGLKVDQKEQSLESGSVAAVESTGEIKEVADSTMPPWATVAEPTPEEAKVMADFAHGFHPGRPLLADLVAAVEDSNATVKTLAVQALKATGEISLLLPMLSKGGDPQIRRTALAAIREYSSRGPDAVARVREQLNEEFGDNLAADVEKLLRSYGSDDPSIREMIPRLVGWLSPDQESIGIRQLALDTLERLTGRDDLGYDPDHPAGKGLDSWNQLLRGGELTKASAARPAK
jgi:hypothetical protein